jgi:sugar (pentulose or hexulose) kinase
MSPAGLAFNVMETFIVIDMGSSSVRCSAYSCSTNTILDHSRVQLKQRMLDNRGRTDADTVFALVNRALDLCINKLRDRSPFSVKALGFSSFAMSLVGCSDKLEALTDVFNISTTQSHEYSRLATDTDVGAYVRESHAGQENIPPHRRGEASPLR